MRAEFTARYGPRAVIAGASEGIGATPGRDAVHEGIDPERSSQGPPRIVVHPGAS